MIIQLIEYLYKNDIIPIMVKKGLTSLNNLIFNKEFFDRYIS